MRQAENRLACAWQMVPVTDVFISLAEELREGGTGEGEAGHIYRIKQQAAAAQLKNTKNTKGNFQLVCKGHATYQPQGEKQEQQYCTTWHF